MTIYPDLFAALAAPFETNEVKVRDHSGRKLLYITARTAMNRLDSVLGPENWWDDYVPSENSVLCRLTIRLPDGQTLTKCDAGGYAGMADQGDDDKSGFSDAFKRAAVKFGVSRYLYRDGVPAFAREAHGEVDDERQAPPRPPARQPADPEPQAQRPRQEPDGDRQYQGPPRSGKALFAWTKDQEQRHEVGLLKYLNSWAKLQDFPSRMIDWDADQVALAYAEGTRKIRSLAAEPTEEALSN